MGSLSLSSAIGGVGEGMMDFAKLKNQNQQRDLDRLHLDRLQEVRNEAAMGRQEQGQEFTAGQADIAHGRTMEALGEQREHEAGVLGEQREYDVEVAGATRAYEDTVREDEQRQEFFIEWLKGEQKRNESGSYRTKDGKWEMTVLAKGETGPNGLPVEVDTYVVREPGTPFAYVQQGLQL